MHRECDKNKDPKNYTLQAHNPGDYIIQISQVDLKNKTVVQLNNTFDITRQKQIVCI